MLYNDDILWTLEEPNSIGCDSYDAEEATLHNINELMAIVRILAPMYIRNMSNDLE